VTRIERIQVLSAIRRGERIFEDVLIRNLGGGLLRTLHSPLFGPGHAAGDYVRLDPDAELGISHVLRGGNVAVQVQVRVEPELDALVTAAREEVIAIGGWPDGTEPLVRDRVAHVFTIPAEAGFDRMEAAFEPLAGRGGALVMYSNIHDFNDGVTPLGWWSEQLRLPADPAQARWIVEDRSWQAELGAALGESERRSQRELNIRGLLGRDYTLDWERGIIEFDAPSGLTRARFEVAGTLSDSEGSWLWAWGNEALPPRVRQRVVTLRSEGVRRSIGELAEAEWPASLAEAEAMIALAFLRVGASAWIKNRLGDDVVGGLLVTEWL
jgi:hypothetical protein